MNKFALAASAVMAAAMLPAAAHAGSPDGKIQVKLLGTGVLPDGGLKEVKYVDPALLDVLLTVSPTADFDTKANDNVVPTIAIEYFLTPNISVEMICCVTQHDVDGAAGLAGTELVSDAQVIPATFTLKYHFTEGPFKPYVGAGPTYFLWIEDKSGATTQALGADSQKMDDEFGFALQAGVDFKLNENGLGLSVDAKRYFVNQTAHWYANGTEVLRTEHDLDPWVVSAGLTYRM
ncbi:OmpW/AlkL family protein [Croceicoccus pelagius]|uniref:Outer membrane protein n=1 Tax=Croceicoccus pelagius TaxID=1703341 RepID=A0A917DM95_9SPHN|nr:OmpW family outer membrane protein [Croceicoccus pelagius]GGD49912.1 outer membrane protein [Croceicoccus pelagius]